MRVENTKIKLTIPIPFDKPDKNGVMYTKEAVEKAVNSLRGNLPIIYMGNVKEMDGVVGVTSNIHHMPIWDFENQVCNMTIDGVVFYGGAELIVNEIEDDKVTDFDIVSIGLSK